MKKLQDRAKEFLSMLRNRREETTLGTILTYELKEEATDRDRDIVRTLLGDHFLDYWKYVIIEQAANMIAEEEDDEDCWSDAPFLDRDLYSWLASSIDRRGYTEEAIRGYGLGRDGLMGAIQCGYGEELMQTKNALEALLLEDIEQG